MSRHASVLLTVLAAACGGGSPAQPTSPAPSPPRPTAAGTLIATNGGQPIAGASIAIGSSTSTTDDGGHYSLNLPDNIATSRFTITRDGLLTHTGYFRNSDSRTLDLDAFVLGSFDAAYFRAIARDGYEEPDRLQPLRRWTHSPMLYVRTIDDTGRPILPEVLQQVITVAEAVVPQYSNGRFGLAGVEQGTDTREDQAGWITVEWTRDASEFCGQASVGREGGFVKLTYDQPGCSCGSQKIRLRTIKHEFGHSMGLWHTGQAADLMSGFGVDECDHNMTPRELQYLDYLYRRPVGNTDPDNDPSSAILLTARIVN